MLTDIINNLAGFIRDNSWAICIAWAASILIIYGDMLLRVTKSIVRKWHFLFRLLFFAIICGFGFGVITIYAARFIHPRMISLDNLWLCISVITAYLILGLLADKNRVI